MKKASGPQHGFTLVEILSVILIITLLIALFASVASAVRKRSKEASCLSNLHQLGLAITMYENDYDQFYPGAQSEMHGWPETIDTYVKDFGVFQCPSSDVPHYEKGMITLPNGQPIPGYVTYIYNIHVGGIDAPRATRPDRQSVNLSVGDIVNPANTVMIADGGTTASVKTLPINWKPKPFVVFMSALLADAYYSGVILPTAGGPSAPRALHSDKATVLYCDGHSRSKRIQDFYNLPETIEVPGKQAGYSPCLDPSCGCLK